MGSKDQWNEALRAAQELRAAYEDTKAELAEAKRKLAMVHQGPGEVWRWQGGVDDLGGLSCPVVMEASTLEAILEMGREHYRTTKDYVARNLVHATVGPWTIEGDPSRGAIGQWRAVGPWRNERAEADGDARAGLGFTRDHPLCVCGHAIEAHKRVSSTNDDDCAYCDCVALRSEHEHCHCCHRRLPESWREPWCSLDCSNDPGDLE